MRLKIGVTGGIGSGKSIVCSVLSTMGYPVFYSDKAAKQIMLNNLELRQQLIELFGPTTYIQETDGTITLNKALIAKAIFNDQAKLQSMNALIHPKVREVFDDFANSYNNTLVFNEAAILFETGAYKRFDKTILVTAPQDIRIKRVINRDQVTKEQVIERMNNQWSDTEKQQLADCIIHNDDKQLVIPQILNMIKQFNA